MSQPPTPTQANETIPNTGPFIYDFHDRSVRNVEILAVMRRWVLSSENTQATDEADTRITIKKTGADSSGPIEMTATYDFGSRSSEDFHALIENTQHIIDLNIEGDSFITISWEGSNNYPLRQWFIPITRVGTITINKT
jgi:hypothetical protein